MALKFAGIVYQNAQGRRIPLAHYTNGKNNIFFSKGSILMNMGLLVEGLKALEAAEKGKEEVKEETDGDA